MSCLFVSLQFESFLFNICFFMVYLVIVNEGSLKHHGESVTFIYFLNCKFCQRGIARFVTSTPFGARASALQHVRRAAGHW